jgi:hypothetical protein
LIKGVSLIFLTPKVTFIMSTYSQDDQNDEELLSLWCDRLELAKNRFLELERLEGYQEVYRTGEVIDKEVSLDKFSKFCDKERTESWC